MVLTDEMILEAVDRLLPVVMARYRNSSLPVGCDVEDLESVAKIVIIERLPRVVSGSITEGLVVADARYWVWQEIETYKEWEDERKSAEREWHEIVPKYANLPENAEDRELKRRCVEELMSLDYERRELVRRNVMQDETLADICRDMEIPWSTANDRLDKALDELRERLNAD
jgi:hypothetical protein